MASNIMLPARLPFRLRPVFAKLRDPIPSVQCVFLRRYSTTPIQFLSCANVGEMIRQLVANISLYFKTLFFSWTVHSPNSCGHRLHRGSRCGWFCGLKGKLCDVSVLATAYLRLNRAIGLYSFAICAFVSSLE